MLRRTLKTIGWTAGCVAALAIVLYLFAVALNWRDREASATAVKLETLYRDRPSVRDEDNAFIYLMGFEAAPAESPQTMGLKRVAWMRQSSNAKPFDARQDPLNKPADYRAARNPKIRKFLDACRPGSVNCAAAFDASEAMFAAWMGSEGWLLERYRGLIAHVGWYDSVPFDPARPLPAYGTVMDGQVLLLLQARALAQKGDYDGTRELLENDNLFWRRVLESSDTLISKMIATAAVTRNLEWGNLIVRRLPPASATRAIPNSWRTSVSDSERSMLRCMIGEFQFISDMLRNEAMSDYIDDENSFGARVADLLLEPMHQPQDSLNAYAEYYLRIAQTWHVPFPQYETAVIETEQLAQRMQVEALPPKSLYNVTGKILMNMGVADFGSYARRVADLEGIRRAVLTAATLREARVPASAARAALATAIAPRNPYTDRPFLWDEKDNAIVFQGLEAGDRGKHEIYY